MPTWRRVEDDRALLESEGSARRAARQGRPSDASLPRGPDALERGRRAGCLPERARAASARPARPAAAAVAAVAAPPPLLVVSEASPAERAHFVATCYTLAALLGWLVVAIFAAVRWALSEPDSTALAPPRWATCAAAVVCADHLIWLAFLGVMLLSAYQRLWLMRHVPRDSAAALGADAAAAAAADAASDRRPSAAGAAGGAADALVLPNTRPRAHAALALHARALRRSFYAVVVASVLSMAWFPCVCAPPFYRMALHGTVAASVVYSAVAATARLRLTDIVHSTTMLSLTLALMVAAAVGSCAAAGAATADVVVGAVGMAVFYWAIVLRCARHAAGTTGSEGGRNAQRVAGVTATAPRARRRRNVTRPLRPSRTGARRTPHPHQTRAHPRAPLPARLAASRARHPSPSLPPRRPFAVRSFSSVVHLVPPTAPVLALSLVIADAFLYNAAVWAWALARRAAGVAGPHARAHAAAVAELEDAIARAAARWRAGARTAAEARAVEGALRVRAEESALRVALHAELADALDLDVYWPRLDLQLLARRGVFDVAAAAARADGVGGGGGGGGDGHRRGDGDGDGGHSRGIAGAARDEASAEAAQPRHVASSLERRDSDLESWVNWPQTAPGAGRRRPLAGWLPAPPRMLRAARKSASFTAAEGRGAAVIAP
jgi:hypothetical protein